jgi:transcription antitermination protein NusB
LNPETKSAAVLLNRRHLRIKALHFLYAYFQSDDRDMVKIEKQLLAGVEKTEELFLWYLALLPRLGHAAQQEIELNKSKRLPTFEDLNPNTRFADIRLWNWIDNHPVLQKKFSNRGIDFTGDMELVRKIFASLKKTEIYQQFMADSDSSWKAERKFIGQLVTEWIHTEESFRYHLEEKSIVWLDDHEAAIAALIKTIQHISESRPVFELPSVYKDEEDDRKFLIDLFRKTILLHQEFEPLIANKTKNWEVDRIAMMDILLIRMALAEAVSFPSIPVKVSMNEFIELSKQYSTPKSSQFINGILDSLFNELRHNGRIKKSGRGLIE